MTNHIEGIGNGSNTYQAFVFIKDCLITEKMILEHCEIIPWRGLECNDKLDSLQDFLTHMGLNILEHTAETLSRCKNNQPTVVIHFPIINADNIDIVGEIIEKEGQMLCDLLAVLRDGYPSMYGSLLLDPSNSTYYKIYDQTYTGNLVGGLIAGEDQDYIKRCMNNLKNNEVLQLYLALYNDARKEKNIEILYFRLWNLLETIALSKGFKGNPRVDWNGRPGKDWKGNIISDNNRLEIKHAQELVFELIRTVFNSAGLPENLYSHNLNQGLVHQLIPIWYRHRNCLVHGEDVSQMIQISVTDMIIDTSIVIQRIMKLFHQIME